MAANLVALAAGLLFSLGLTLSGMIDPARILGFLDVAGVWNPILGVVMASAVAVAAVGFALGRRLAHPLAGSAFHPPGQTAIDARLVGGAALFGIGWGLVGYCPGPALASLGLGLRAAWLFALAMIAGMVLAGVVAAARRRRCPG
jgi:uncharacterized membrane protein YedE/YeeE